MTDFVIVIPGWCFAAAYIAVKFGIACYLQPYYLQAHSNNFHFHPLRFFLSSFLMEPEKTIIKGLVAPFLLLYFFIVYRDLSSFSMRAILPSVFQENAETRNTRGV